MNDLSSVDLLVDEVNGYPLIQVFEQSPFDVV